MLDWVNSNFYIKRKKFYRILLFKYSICHKSEILPETVVWVFDFSLLLRNTILTSYSKTTPQISVALVRLTDKQPPEQNDFGIPFIHLSLRCYPALLYSQYMNTKLAFLPRNPVRGFVLRDPCPKGYI